jgi:hypothetical protein
MLMPPGEPRIFVEVLRPVGSGFVQSRVEITLLAWEKARNPGDLAVAAVNQCLAELGYKP